MELCMVEDYEIASWFVSWLSSEPQRPTLSTVLNYDTNDINALDYNIQQQEDPQEQIIILSFALNHGYGYLMNSKAQIYDRPQTVCLWALLQQER